MPQLRAHAWLVRLLFVGASLLPMSLCCSSTQRLVAMPASAKKVASPEPPRPSLVVVPAPSEPSAPLPPEPVKPPECERLLAQPALTGQLPSPIGVPRIQDRSGVALAPFYTALSAAAGGRSLARIMYFGDSHVATDVMTGRVRQNLQARFGDAGLGFVMPAKPARWYAHAQIAFERARNWQVLAVRKPDGLGRQSGPSGFALRSDKRALTSLRIATDAAAVRFELYFLRQPGGGTLQVTFDEQSSSAWSTAGAAGPDYAQLSLSPAPRHVALDTPGDGTVTVFGLTLEHGKSGVVLDTLGIPGARVRDHLLWDDTIYRAHLRKRDPALVVLAYGTNEGTDTREPVEVYEQQLRQVVGRIRDTLPGSACLLVGPTDHPQQLRPDAAFRERRRTGLIVEAQRKVAAELGCGFINLVAVTGGPMSMMRLVAEHLGARDHTHFTRRGYEALGDAISAALLDGYGVWQNAGCPRSQSQVQARPQPTVTPWPVPIVPPSGSAPSTKSN